MTLVAGPVPVLVAPDAGPDPVLVLAVVVLSWLQPTLEAGPDPVLVDELDRPQLQQDGNVTSVSSGQDRVKTGVGQDESGTGGGRLERGGHYGELPEYNR